ncbi:MAG: hypothetical protein IID41_11590 [Planctomycetes bacterium]|nr:hypothetical protein [Planctomycetota bacterium]
MRSRLGGMGKYACPWVRHGGLESNTTLDTGKSTCPCHPGNDRWTRIVGDAKYVQSLRERSFPSAGSVGKIAQAKACGSLSSSGRRSFEIKRIVQTASGHWSLSTARIIMTLWQFLNSI